MISISVSADELFLRLDRLPRRMREAIKSKFRTEIDIIYEKLFQGKPGEFFNKEFISHGVSEVGTAVSGFIEVLPQEGKYPIVPIKARALQFIAKDYTLVHTKLVMHPYLSQKVRGGYVEALLLRERENIESSVEDAVIEATSFGQSVLRRGR